ncbi:MAG: cupin domain-containing protein, partial [Kiritimatiellae bacterium]|nr:cupin domain-containing protein [Kiritimatiellia bacterium]
VTHTGKAKDGYTYHSLARGKPDRHMDPFKIELAPGAAEAFSSHEGEELIICTKGKVRIDYGTETTILEPGDTAYYNSVVKHCVRAAGDEQAEIYGIVFVPF